MPARRVGSWLSCWSSRPPAPGSGAPGRPRARSPTRPRSGSRSAAGRRRRARTPRRPARRPDRVAQLLGCGAVDAVATVDRHELETGLELVDGRDDSRRCAPESARDEPVARAEHDEIAAANLRRPMRASRTAAVTASVWIRACGSRHGFRRGFEVHIRLEGEQGGDALGGVPRWARLRPRRPA